MSALENIYKEASFLHLTNARLISFQFYQLCFSIAALAIAVIAVGLVLTRPIENHYVMVNESGQVITEFDFLSDPLVTSAKVRQFSDDCVRKVLNIDFVHYKTQLSNAETCFTRNGFVQVIGLMRDQGILAELSNGYNVGSILPRKANFLRAVSKSRSNPKWLVKGSYIWSLKQGTKTVQYPLTIEATIKSMDMTHSVHGMAIDALTITKG